MDYKAQALKARLHVPYSFELMSNEELEQFGCGAGETGDKFVPDTMYLLNVKVCCIIHDLDWSEAKIMADIERANERFLVNLIRFINTYSNAIMQPLRRYRATTYYSAVEDIGKKIWGKKYEKLVEK